MKKILFTLAILLALGGATQAISQNKTKAEWVSGQISISHDLKEAFYLNFMGPNLCLKLKKWTIGASFFPSLRISETLITPNLGFGGYIGYKKVLLTAPLYYINNVWIPAVGLGYRFVK